MQKILLLEDDITLGSGIRLALQSPSVQIALCRTLAQARNAFEETGFDLLIHVSDTGPGIAEEEQPRVFRRFYRGAEHAEEEGVGIGLYLVRQIAEGQGGYVKVSSQMGVGSTFSLYLPR